MLDTNLREQVYEANLGIYRAGLVAIADEFGVEIPCIPYTDNIGNAIVKGRNRAPAVLLANHGVFAFGKDSRSAMKTAVMLEDVSKTCHLALLLGKPPVIPEDEVEKWYGRYHTTYGQPGRIQSE